MPRIENNLFISLLCAFLLAATPPALALEADQVKGEVLSVDPEYRFITLQVEESGDEIAASVGSVQTYYVPESVTPKYETVVSSVIYSTDEELALKRLAAGDDVTIDFRTVNERFEFEKMTNTEPRDPGVRADATQYDIVIVELEDLTPQTSDRQYAASTSGSSRSSLPDTASSMPMLPLFAIAFVIIALGLRAARFGERS